jgi:hypothetical protein
LCLHGPVERVEVVEALQVVVLLEVDERLLPVLRRVNLVFEALHHAAQVLEVAEPLELLEDVDHLGELAQVPGR